MDYDKYPDTYDKIIWFVARPKAFMKGFGQGFYGDPDFLADDKCLDDDPIESFFNMWMAFEMGKGFIDTSMRALAAGQVLTQGLLDKCRDYQFFYDIAAYCFDSKACDSFGAIIMNVATNLLSALIASCQILLTFGTHFWPTKLKGLWTKYRDWGIQMGHITVALTDYKENRDKRPSWTDKEKIEAMFKETVLNHESVSPFDKDV